MKKAVLSLALAMLVFFSGCSANQATTYSEQPTASPTNTVEIQETNIPTPTPESGAEVTKNQIQFDMDLEAGKMNVVADYIKSDINGSAFLLNRDFIVTAILCDGEHVSVDEIMETVFLDGEYEVKQYNLPSFQETVHIEYTGVLSGKTGSSPYVRETISPEFTFLRQETFCHPMFANADNYKAAVFMPFNLHISVIVPDGYTAMFAQDNAQQEKTSDGTLFTASGNLMFYQIAIAIAKYQKIEMETGDYYFLESTDVDKASAMIDPTMTHAYTFMNEHFGEVEFPQKLRVVEIPGGFGSFAITETHMTFVEGSAFNSVFAMRQLVQEFIHTGWNAKVISGSQVQRARFFDEAFTNYFEYRVMTDILGDNTAKTYSNMFKNTLGYELVPISEYGKYGYGDLCYTIGALCLQKLAELVGVETFDKATMGFLKKYKDTPVDFDLFCAEYIEQCSNPDVEVFFQKWIYSNEYQEDIR